MESSEEAQSYTVTASWNEMVDEKQQLDEEKLMASTHVMKVHIYQTIQLIPWPRNRN